MNVAIGSQTVPRSVVVTEMTATTSLADGLDETWAALVAGASGIRALIDPELDRYALPVRIGGTLRNDPGKSITRVERRRLSFVEQMALMLVRRLWPAEDIAATDPERVAVSIGTGLGGGEVLVRSVDALRADGFRKVPPLAVPMIMPNGPAAVVGLEICAKGGVHTPVSACSSGSEAVAQAWRLVATGEADVVVAGGVEGRIGAVPLASFSSMRALSTRNDSPREASRPFDQDRDGFVFGEAGALLLVEAEEHARARGAAIRGRLLGAGITSDAYHLVAPTPDGDGIARAMRKAIQVADVDPRDIGHVNAHATSTRIGDLAEAFAIAQVTPAAAVYAPKSATGHSIGAAGALEAALTLLTLRDGRTPPTLNLDRADQKIEIDVSARLRRLQGVELAISNSVGFGGHNVSLVLGRA
ncbi:beta-ketoacyl-ACP synthase II [Rhodococcus sp. HNM0569]|uniref:beta-ketoacyl-ACP synthase II n=1 Tax=Rhodococcus sp. HNM0569 TaxID=2716340 RepID=UPI00146E9580|nr:beta-ketoacyl-ACP synthase II [Rhodococcus sp. HNM0569]NLU83765.1 beta-ketoacyl-ACP synthase II [Rhodococcus sp. HNM0569]